MKILLVLAIFMATLSSLSAQDSSQGSLRIDREIKQFTEGVKARSLSIARDVIKRVQASPTQFFDQFQTVQERIITRLNGLGPEGASIASNITNDIVSLSDRLKNEFSDGNLNSKAIQFLRNLETRSLKPISDSVESLKQAVDGNPKFIKCWDQNKGLLKQLINKTLRESVNIIQDILPNLKIRTDKWARRVIENIQNAEIYVEQNCSDVNCTADFFDKNREIISSQANAFASEARESIYMTLNGIQESVNSLAQLLTVRYSRLALNVYECVSRLAVEEN